MTNMRNISNLNVEDIESCVEWHVKNTPRVVYDLNPLRMPMTQISLMKEIFVEPTRSYNFMKQIIEDFKEDEYRTLSHGWK